MVHKIEVSNQMGKPVTLQGVEDILGKNMLLLSHQQFQKIILSSNPRVKDVTVEKVFPQTIRFHVVLADAVAFYKVTDETYVLVSQDGVVTGIQYEKPEVSGEIVYYQQVMHGEYNLGKPMPFLDFRFAAGLASHVTRFTSEPYKIIVTDSDQLDIILSETVIRASYDDNPTRQLNALADVLKMIRSGAQRIKFVDLRFDKLIIEKW